MNLLTAARNYDPNPLKGGASIVVDEDSLLSLSISDPSEDTTREPRDQISIYIVREGDTLSGIAQMFDVEINTIWWSNDLKTTKAGHPNIQPGQELLIFPIDGVEHEVAHGGTIADIADIYEGDAQEIANYNGIPVDQYLEKGETVFVPGGKLRAETPKPSGSGEVVYSSPAPLGYFIHPLPGARKTQGIHGHNGVDFGASPGTRVLAAASGKVMLVRSGGWNGGYGTYVVIEHNNGTQTLYAHLSGVEAWRGQNVVAGQVIGYVGNTGRSTGPHLHFEVRGASNPF